MLSTRPGVGDALTGKWRVGRAVRSWAGLGSRVTVRQDLRTGAPGFVSVSGRELLLGSSDATVTRRTSDERVVLARTARGRGSVCLLGSAATLSDAEIASSNAGFLTWLVRLWNPDLLRVELAGRMRRPQRHRLLHGYPMAPLMHDASLHAGLLAGAALELGDLSWNDERKLTVGVLPHPFCNPAVKGCGFCTFPHQDYERSRSEETVAHVIRELDASPFWKGKPPVTALYFGGATANLTPPESFRALCQALSRRFDLTDAEVTLEGVPAYFVAKKPSLLEVLREELPARHYRISMGVQTFDPAQIARMGRTAFGDRAVIRKALEHAKGLGCTVSGDFLFDLPGQTLVQMRADVDTATDLGFDQVCLYHLVLAPELGTEWSRDADLLARLPTNERACENWLDLRERTLGKGFVQATLTNFERREVHESDRRFVYEECGYQPESYDTLGFGPSALSLLGSDAPWRPWALKLMNPERASEYVAAVATGRGPERLFVLRLEDRQILHLTRKLALLSVSRSAYADCFEVDPTAHFGPELDALERAGLVTVDAETIALTPRGMFYADSCAGLIASSRVRQQSGRGSQTRDLNRAIPGPMG